MLKIAVVEDEGEMAGVLCGYLDVFLGENKLDANVQTFSNAKVFLNTYQSDFDLIFMDINLPELNGMDAIRGLRKRDETVMVIFVTSLAQYAIKGYEVNAFDFILKPFSYYNFVLKMQRALPILQSKSKRIITFSSKSSHIKIEISLIKYIEVMDHKIIVHTTKGDYESFGVLSKYIDMLKDDGFVLCSRSYLVNLKYVSEIDQNFAYVDGDKLLISRPRRKEFLHDFNMYLGKWGD